MSEEAEKKIIVDEDWKSRVTAEKRGSEKVLSVRGDWRRAVGGRGPSRIRAFRRGDAGVSASVV